MLQIGTAATQHAYQAWNYAADDAKFRVNTGVARSIQGIAMKSRLVCLPLLSVLSLAFAAPALAQAMPPMPMPMPAAVDAEGRTYGDAGPDMRPEWHGEQQRQPGYDQAGYQQARAGWLDECRRHHGNGNTVGGAVVGAVVGGVIGNRVAGSGNRTVGTVIGAAAGGVAGGAIGSAADRRSARDYCEAYLDQYTSQQGYGQQGYGQQGYGQQGYSYGYAPMMVMVPVMMVPVATSTQQRECKETIVTEEWVTVSEQRRTRYIAPRHYRAVPDKRVRIVPEKRVRVN